MLRMSISFCISCVTFAFDEGVVFTLDRLWRAQGHVVGRGRRISICGGQPRKDWDVG